jgi:hypothetical protein
VFDTGWNEMREQIFANQKKLGVIPANAQLTPWPDELKKWDTLSADEKKLFAPRRRSSLVTRRIQTMRLAG